MDGSTHRSDADRELSELRERAYGPDPDIDVDPAALVRLRELEAAHSTDPGSHWGYSSMTESAASASVPLTITIADTPAAPHRVATEPPRHTDAVPSAPVKNSRIRSIWQRATATSRSRFAWAASALIVVSVVATALFVAAPRPDATLHRTAARADTQVLGLVAQDTPWLEIDAAHLRAYGSFLGLEIWSGTDAFDSPCLIAVNRANDTVSEARCVPAAAELIMDIASFGDDFDGLRREGIVRFIYRDDRVDAYVYLMPGAD
ncbi:hypothetical protein [Microbacterium pumilum]|uniref:Uncharacterized protein n=1 Tax=Microbacterium pumilum TaxID=344165 RepID=A0ABN2SHH8_9MICO